MLMSINTFVALPLMRNCNLLRLPKRQLECREAIALLRLFFTRADGGVAASPARRFSFDVPDCPHTRIVLKYIAFQFSISLAAQFTFFFIRSPLCYRSRGHGKIPTGIWLANICQKKIRIMGIEH